MYILYKSFFYIYNKNNFIEMPIKLKKTDIQNIDAPKEGYMILGFDSSGRLVSKDSSGVSDPIVPIVSTGSFVNLDVEQLTVGTRLYGTDVGVNSISQGSVNTASGIASFTQGNSVEASGNYSRARGEFLLASGDYSYVSGKGQELLNKLQSGGLNSFVHSYATTPSGTLSNYSVILGGVNHNIGTSSDNSVILGGNDNSINNSKQNVAVIVCNGITTPLSNSVYVPRLVLSSSSGLDASTTVGTIEYNGSIFRGYKSDGWQTFGNGYILSGGTSSPTNDQIAVWTNSNTIEGTTNFTYNSSGFLGVGNGITFSSGGTRTITISNGLTTNTLSILGQTNSIETSTVGGAVNIIGGAGAGSSGAVAGGNGGDLNLVGGAGGSSLTGSDGFGGDVYITGGNAGGSTITGINGGNVYINVGTGHSNGEIYLGNTTTIPTGTPGPNQVLFTDGSNRLRKGTVVSQTGSVSSGQVGVWGGNGVMGGSDYLRLPYGSASVPTYSFGSNSDTGMYGDADSINFSVNNIQKGEFNPNELSMTNANILINRTDANAELRIQNGTEANTSPVISLFKSEAAETTLSQVGTLFMISRGPSTHSIADLTSTAKLKIGGSVDIITSNTDFINLSGNTDIKKALGFNLSDITSTTYYITNNESFIVWHGASAGTVYLPVTPSLSQFIIISNVSSNNLSINGNGSPIRDDGGTPSSITIGGNHSCILINAGGGNGDWISISVR